MMDEVENGSLWLLLLRQSLQWVDVVVTKGRSKWKLERTWFWIEGVGWPRWWCQALEDILTPIDTDLGVGEAGHSYTPSLHRPINSTSFVCRSLTEKWEEKNSMDAWLVEQNFAMEIKFLVMFGTQRTFCKWKERDGEGREVKPVWEMCNPVPSLMTMSSVPSYGVWRDKFSRSAMTWWEAPLSSIQPEMTGSAAVVTCALGGQVGGGGGGRGSPCVGIKR